MFNVQMSWTNMELLPLVCLCLLTWSGTTFADGNETEIRVLEGRNATLPCSLSSRENIGLRRFEWKKGGQKKVLVYDGGVHSNNGFSGQDPQFKGRVSYFEDGLRNGNASITIRDTKLTDSGDYTCEFPGRQEKCHIKLVVETKIIVLEGRNATLPCSLSSRESIGLRRIEWMKDGQQEVLVYDSSRLSGQDPQFKDRVSYSEDGLRNGNASITIRDTKVADSGIYTCKFPGRQEICHIKLVVGAAPEPSIRILGETKDGELLQCVVRGASPKPKVEWKDSSGNILPAEEPLVTERGGRYNITLQTTVTKTDRYRCVATQEEISHQTYHETFVSINESQSGLVAGVAVGAVLGTLFIVGGVLAVRTRRHRFKKGLPRDKINGRAEEESFPVG
ncbi:butyrophilin subfamily 1 member A1 isoform X2 [Lates calcarifer]|uniref:Butyrophilin subfamily 1 member A1 isoform X2 n=1 Tax=Lates calcarifer TaxID=8187 RepID=A0AAJ7V5T1_LATCA|nr:butyrophilin subfamily 1 member A1 isoform X2 [Lates calcarifer]